MKTMLPIACLSACSVMVLGEGLTLPENDPYIQDFLNPPQAVPLTEEELADPPTGEIRKKHLRDVNQLRTLLASVIEGVPAGENGQGSPWFAKVQDYKTGLDTVASGALQSDCFALIPKIDAVLAYHAETAQGDAVPEFVQEAAGLANGFSTVLLYAMQRHIIDQNGTVSAANLTGYTKVFSVAGFCSEGDWEDEPKPVDAAGVMILDATAVVAHLESQPWQEAAQFIGNRTVAEAFERYAANGNGLGVLKTKFAANQATITAKWDELRVWVAEQEAASP